MTAQNSKWSRLDLAALGFTAACVAIAAVTSDREFLSFRLFLKSAGHIAPNAPAFEAPVSRAIQTFMAVLYAACPGLAFIAYRPGRVPRPRRRGPGHIALAIVVGFACWGLANWCWFFTGPAAWSGYDQWASTGWPLMFWVYMPTGSGDCVAGAIVAAWLYLAVIGGWRRADALLEITGRWIGASWVFTAVAAWGIDILRSYA